MNRSSVFPSAGAKRAARIRQLAGIAAYAYARDRGLDASSFGDSVTIWKDGAEYEVTTFKEARQLIEDGKV